MESAVAFVRADTLRAWKGTSLLVVSPRGDCHDGHSLTGFYDHETRVLSTLRLRINGREPWLCDAAAIAPDTLAFTYVHPEITTPGGGGTGQADDQEKLGDDGIPERAIDVRATFRVRPGRLDLSLIVANRARRPLTFELSCLLDADYADIQESLFGNRRQAAPVTTRPRGEGVEFVSGHPQLPDRTDVQPGGGWTWRDGGLEGWVTLDPQESRTLTLRAIAALDGSRISEDEAARRVEAAAAWQRRMTVVTAPGNRLFEKVLHANVRDIASLPLLDGPEDEWLALQAGMPAYPAFFGRDAVTAGWQAAYLDHGEALAAALTVLTRRQSDRVDEWRDAEPGRIPYQMRTGPLARLGLNPYSAYYADYASPLMFVISLANLYSWTGDAARIRPFWDAARRILDWARDRGDQDSDGYLEYQTRSATGTKNQGWKDSGDAIVYDDGSPVPSPIATCELQGYWYLAQELMAILCVALDAAGDAADYRTRAADLKRRFNRDWWVEPERCYALALDPDKRQVGAVTSNVGHCLATGIIARERLPAVVGRLFAPDMFSGWGVRTLSSSHAFYNPLSYHRGSVWAVEQATIAFGLRRFGFDARALDLITGLYDLAQCYPGYRIPECVGGYARHEHPLPGAYPRSNDVQLWNATAFTLVVQALIGLFPLAMANTLLIDPVLPRWLPEIVLRDLRVGGARITLRCWRDGDETKWDVLHRSGTIHVLRQPPPESLTAKVKDRLIGAFESIGRSA